MNALVGGAMLAVVFAVIVAVFAWQGGRRRSGDAAVYVIDDAAAFVHARLDPATAERVSRLLVRRVLEWQIEYQQVVAPRAGEHPVVGGGDSIEYVMSRAEERGDDIAPKDIAEVVAADVDYLMAIGAVGAPVEEEAR